jgi:hypothetical protein
MVLQWYTLIDILMKSTTDIWVAEYSEAFGKLFPPWFKSISNVNEENVVSNSQKT